MNSWLLLIIGGLFEVGFTFCMGKIKESSGVEMWLWVIGFLVCMTCSLVMMGKAMLELPIGTAYAVWTGIGAVGTVVVGIVFFKEPVDFWRLFFIFTLIASIIGLKFVSEK